MRDPALAAHQEWLGYVQPVGIVVSPPALFAAQAFVDANAAPAQQRFLAWTREVHLGDDGEPAWAIADLPGLLADVLEWDPSLLHGAPGADALPAALEEVLPDYGETLRPTYAVPELDPGPGQGPWLMLIQELPAGTDLDQPFAPHDRAWHASPQARLERLLRTTGVAVGLLGNGTHLRLVYAPSGETSGHATFPVAAMREVSGRPIFAALRLLLGQERCFALGRDQRLPHILAESRRYQNQVSSALAEQVLAALNELLRGLQAADDHAGGALLAEALGEEPAHVYSGLLTVLMRLVFVLYAEDREMLPVRDPVYVQHYSISGLFERLRADHGYHPDTMDQRYGAWPRLLALFRLIHDGARHGGMRLPPRHGALFSPDRFNFLEGRPWKVVRVMGGREQPPLISDGVIYRVLANLLVLDGERLSYRNLDVEQIGSVYEAMMGFALLTASGRSIAVRAAKQGGAPIVVDLDALLARKKGERAKRLRELTGQALGAEAAKALDAASSPEAAAAALGRKVAARVTPAIVAKGAMILQPSDERRRSGSHYTPRSLTEPIVRKTLEPVLARLGERPTAEQLLELKLCDPAMGSGAFLVEACRQLGDRLVAAWHAHGVTPAIPPDEDEIVHARRLVAQRCLYGVDKNPMAVDLAKLSLWLATLAREHPFTFVDHALRCGDSLVGLGREQIADFHWAGEPHSTLLRPLIDARIQAATDLRARIRAAGDDASEESQRALLRDADDALDDVRLIGDLVVAAFFAAGKPKERLRQLNDLATDVNNRLRRGDSLAPLAGRAHELREAPFAMPPFHWQIEFPEVFDRTPSGFDAFVGNPPFLGGTKISSHLSAIYLDWLKSMFPEAGNRTDLIAYFFRRAFEYLRDQGAQGLVATNTIAQGDTRSGGLRIICRDGGIIFSARRRLKWPGDAAVVVSVVHIGKGTAFEPILDGRPAARISAFLFDRGGDENPATLSSNAGRCFEGFKLAGQGFVFDNDDPEASPLADRDAAIEQDPNSAALILPYLGGEEVNSHPRHQHRRYAINFGNASLTEAQSFPPLIEIVRAKVKPLRDVANRASHQKRWWQYGEVRPGLVRGLIAHDQVMVRSRVSTHHGIARVPSRIVFAESLDVFLFDTYAAFCALQARPHEVWARFFASSMKDDLRYTPSDCFETFPFPEGFATDARLEEAGKAYYEYRAALMVRRDEGLTKTYNRFHDPGEAAPEILRLRELHAAMDRAVLDAYGWDDLQPSCDFLLDYEDDDGEGAGKKKKPWRWRWPDELRDEVLARLLALNQERAAAERAAAPKPRAAAKRPGRGRKAREADTAPMFDEVE